MIISLEGCQTVYCKCFNFRDTSGIAYHDIPIDRPDEHGTRLIEKNVFTQLFPIFHLSNWSDK